MTIMQQRSVGFKTVFKTAPRTPGIHSSASSSTQSYIHTIALYSAGIYRCVLIKKFEVLEISLQFRSSKNRCQLKIAQINQFLVQYRLMFSSSQHFKLLKISLELRKSKNSCQLKPARSGLQNKIQWFKIPASNIWNHASWKEQYTSCCQKTNQLSCIVLQHWDWEHQIKLLLTFFMMRTAATKQNY